ncbi:MAG: DUF3291 domain-containing protein [Rhodovibrio sp.]|nr:DUF3291 domain-containing protein [Rhodovibrio sp.]
MQEGDLSSAWQLAQLNIARLLAPQGDPQVQGFFDQLDRINAHADAAPGFVWRLQDAGGDATGVEPTADPLLIVNLSVWRDRQSLFDFVYKSAHTPVMAKRRHWFARFDGAHQALWWVPGGHKPSTDEGFARLWHLEHYGPTPHAFTFKASFPLPDQPAAGCDMQPDPGAPAKASANSIMADRALIGKLF